MEHHLYALDGRSDQAVVAQFPLHVLRVRGSCTKPVWAPVVNPYRAAFRQQVIDKVGADKSVPSDHQALQATKPFWLVNVLLVLSRATLRTERIPGDEDISSCSFLANHKKPPDRETPPYGQPEMSLKPSGTVAAEARPTSSNNSGESPVSKAETNLRTDPPRIPICVDSIAIRTIRRAM